MVANCATVQGMPVREEETDWIEPPYRRLARVEKSVAQGVEDIAQLKRDVNRMSNTLEVMTGDELADLKHRAELPRRILVAIAVPVLVAVFTAILLTLVGHVHLG